MQFFKTYSDTIRKKEKLASEAETSEAEAAPDVDDAKRADAEGRGGERILEQRGWVQRREQRRKEKGADDCTPSFPPNENGGAAAAGCWLLRCTALCCCLPLFLLFFSAPTGCGGEKRARREWSVTHFRA